MAYSNEKQAAVFVMEIFDKTANMPRVEQSCCFTGHRVMPKDDVDIEKRLVCEVETLINGFGVTNFYAGGALGFDTLAAECVIRLKSKYPFIRLTLALPCKNQAEKWQEADKARYRRMLDMADSVCYISEDYTSACMRDRNDFMLDGSRFCICYLRHTGGGTHYTVNRAKRLGKELIEL